MGILSPLGKASEAVTWLVLAGYDVWAFSGKDAPNCSRQTVASVCFSTASIAIFFAHLAETIGKIVNATPWQEPGILAATFLAFILAVRLLRPWLERPAWETVGGSWSR
jgi:hypothetical protein